MYFQGVANSYSDIKKSRTSITNSSSSINGTKDSFKRYLCNIVKVALSMPIYLKSSKDVKLIKKKMGHAYNDGYKFHQIQAKNDPVLLKWILKENYWDYYLRPYMHGNESTGTMEKSY